MFGPGVRTRPNATSAMPSTADMETMGPVLSKLLSLSRVDGDPATRPADGRTQTAQSSDGRHSATWVARCTTRTTRSGVRTELLCSRPEGSRFTSVCVDGAMDDGVGELADGVALDAARSRDEREQHSPVERHEGGDRLWRDAQPKHAVFISSDREIGRAHV